MRVAVLTCWAAMMAMTAGAVAQTPTAPAPAAAMPAPVMRADDGYRLGVNDEVEVTIFGPSNQVTRTRIKEDGTITLPYVGPVRARDRTARQFADDISAALRSGGYFVKPVVSVDVTQFISNSVTVSGEVQQPGVFPLDRALTVGMMLARAGGTRPGGADYVILRRQGDPAEHKIVAAELSGEWSSATPLAAGDTLYVPVAPQVFVYGQVNGPGSFAIQTGMTVRQALIRAGGPTLAGSEKKISIYRNGKKSDKVDLESLVESGDILFVRERLF